MKKQTLKSYFFSISSVLACDYKTLSQFEIYETSKLVLIAKLDSNFNEGHFISVLETLKSAIDESVVLTYENNCSINLNAGGKWLSCAHKVEDN